MSKIIKVTEQKVSIGLEGGGIKEVGLDNLNFLPKIGDEVEVFESETEIIVTKKETKKEIVKGDGININVNNSATNTVPTYSSNSSIIVNKVIYCLLCFFLGGIGIHKFYAGKTGSGVLYLIFCWTGIPVVIAFIELIIALCKSADSKGNISL